MNLDEAIQNYLAAKTSARPNSNQVYRNAMNRVRATLAENGLDLSQTSPDRIPTDSVSWLIANTADLSPSTERLYVGVLVDFLKYLVAEELSAINLVKLDRLVRWRSRRPGKRLPFFPENQVVALIEHASALHLREVENREERLINLRDRAFILTLADTGLRVHEACELVRGDLDRDRRRAVIIGKGNKEALVRFSARAISAIDDYLSERSPLDGQTGRQLSSLPVFCRHDKGAGRRIKGMTTRSGQNILRERVREALGDSAIGSITPHTLRHYFVTRVVRSAGIQAAREMARHENIAITARYAHLNDRELDESYQEIFDGRPG